MMSAKKRSVNDVDAFATAPALANTRPKRVRLPAQKERWRESETDVIAGKARSSDGNAETSKTDGRSKNPSTSSNSKQPSRNESARNNKTGGQDARRKREAEKKAFTAELTEFLEMKGMYKKSNAQQLPEYYISWKICLNY